MVNPTAAYKIIGVAAGRVVEGKHRGYPSESWLCEFGKRRGVEFVIRYFPSRKGWRALDLRNAQCFSIQGEHRSFWTGQVRGRYYPTEDAAVMYAMAILGGA